MALTKEDIFKRLDRRLKKDERLALASAGNLDEYHFGLGLWVRNTWHNKPEIVSLFADGGGMDIEGANLVSLVVTDGDLFSDRVLSEYQQYLCEKLGCNRAWREVKE